MINHVRNNYVPIRLADIVDYLELNNCLHLLYFTKQR